MSKFKEGDVVIVIKPSNCRKSLLCWPYLDPSKFLNKKCVVLDCDPFDKTCLVELLDRTRVCWISCVCLLHYNMIDSEAFVNE